MHEVLFRGKREDNGEWVYGAFCPDVLEAEYDAKVSNGFIRRYSVGADKMMMFEVDRETVGQYTGLCDKNGARVFEGDILQSRASEIQSEWKYWKVEYIDGSFVFNRDTVYHRKHKHEEDLLCADNIGLYGLYVVGNIYDNPELR